MVICLNAYIVASTSNNFINIDVLLHANVSMLFMEVIGLCGLYKNK